MTNSTGRLTKTAARAQAYNGLHSAKATRFPFPIEGRIPNFVGAEAAAKRLRELPVYTSARAIKVNPDAPQLPVRAMALADGKILFMPSPRLAGMFLCIDPADVPAGEERRAAALSHCHRYGREIDVQELAHRATGDQAIELIVTGSVALTRSGARAGKGEGYSDLEYALLQELGLPRVPVVSTVHPAQLVRDMDVDPHDLSVDMIVTPDEVIETRTPYPKPARVHWELLSEERLESMPILNALRRLRWEELTVPEIIAEDLCILFVGINPGRKSAESGHNFAGPGNHFWRLLYESGLTPVHFAPKDERALLQHGLGITNIVTRASRSETDLTWDELLAGGETLRQRVETYRPNVLALLGKNVYRAFAGKRRSAKVEWGLQPHTGDHTSVFVAPNPSARSTIPYQERLAHFCELKALAQG